MELSTAHELHPMSGPAPRTRDALGPLARYTIVSELGGGGMSTVCLAHDSVTGRVVAIKRISERGTRVPGAAQRFAREAGIVEQLRHPNIVEIIAVERDGATRGAAYDATPAALVTAYVRGASLRDVLATSGALPVERTVRVLRDIAAALAYTHARHIVHRDVKPANILIEDGGGRAVLADFGIACESGALPDLEDGLTIGTPAYMAPEQIEGRVADPRADVYALCVVGWEMLAGSMPWLGAPLADVLHRQRYESLPDLAQLRPDIPVYLLRAINGGLAKDPTLRWRDGAELLHELSPRPTPIEPPRHAPAAIAATVWVETPAVAATPGERATSAGSAAVSAAPRHPRKTRVLTTALGTIAIALALGGLAPRLSRGAATPRPSVDPELDSMLTLAVMPRPPVTPPSGRSIPTACRAGGAIHVAHCSAVARRPAKARARSPTAVARCPCRQRGDTACHGRGHAFRLYRRLPIPRSHDPF